MGTSSTSTCASGYETLKGCTLETPPFQPTLALAVQRPCATLWLLKAQLGTVFSRTQKLPILQTIELTVYKAGPGTLDVVVHSCKVHTCHGAACWKCFATRVVTFSTGGRARTRVPWPTFSEQRADSVALWCLRVYPPVPCPCIAHSRIPA